MYFELTEEHKLIQESICREPAAGNRLEKI
jgi:hypothetical protein